MMGLGTPGGLDADFATLDKQDRYKILCGLVIPRPIAWVTTLGTEGQVNAAPFSFFNVFSEDPPLVVLGLQTRGSGSLKDTTANVRRTGEFVVNMVSEAWAEQMNACSADYGPEVSEIAEAGLSLSPSASVRVPAIAEAPAAFECRRTMMINMGLERDLLVGEVLRARAAPGVIDPDRFHADLDAYRPLARLFGSWYARLREPFTMVRPSTPPASGK